MCLAKFVYDKPQNCHLNGDTYKQQLNAGGVPYFQTNTFAGVCKYAE